MVRVFFNNQLITNPKEWEELSVTIKTDHASQTTLIEYEESLTFVQDGYDFLYSRINTSCELINVVIQMNVEGTWNTIVEGVIFIGDCVFNELVCEVTTRIQDDGYSARVQNNRNIEVSLVSKTTKNGEPLTAPVSSAFYMFEPSTGTPFYIRRGFSVYECFKYLVSWMTDNKVGFESNYFQSGAGSFTMVLSGRDVRVGDAAMHNEPLQPPVLKFAELFDTFRKLENIGLGYKRDTTGKPILVIEDIAHFRGSNVVLNLDKVNETELDFVQELLFAKVVVGSSITQPWECDNGNTRCTAGNNLLYFGFSKEEYGFTGECNKEIALDLSIGDNYVIDTSTIEDVVVYGNEAYDDSNFLVRWYYNPAPFKWSTQTDPIGTGIWWYNEYFTNKEVVARYQAYLFGAILLYGLQYDVHLFKVEGNVSSDALLPQQFPIQHNWQPSLDTVVYDVDGVYQLNPLNRFQPRDEGAYKLWAGCLISYTINSSDQVIVSGYFLLKHYNQNGVLITTYNSLLQFNFATYGVNNFFIEREFPWIYLDDNDYVEWSIEYWQDMNPNIEQAEIFFSFGIDQKHYIECRESRVVVRNDIPTSGADRRIIRTTTREKHVPWDRMKAYLKDTTQRIKLSNERINRTGWNDNVKHTFVSGKTDVSILND